MIKIAIIKSADFPNYGYNLSHNQPKGFKGIEGNVWGWYKYKKDAKEAAEKLEKEWNKSAQ